MLLSSLTKQPLHMCQRHFLELAQGLAVDYVDGRKKYPFNTCCLLQCWRGCSSMQFTSIGCTILQMSHVKISREPPRNADLSTWYHILFRKYTEKWRELGSTKLKGLSIYSLHLLPQAQKELHTLCIRKFHALNHQSDPTHHLTASRINVRTYRFCVEC